jgi:aspartyl protease family protein
MVAMPDQAGSLVYLVLLLLGVSVFALPAIRRGGLGKMAKGAGAWALIFVGVTFAVGILLDMQGEMPSQSQAGALVEVPRAADGHYHLMLELDGTPVRFLVDTGASAMVLTREDAARAGIDPGELIYTSRAMTANGEVRIAPARVGEVRLGDIVDRDVRVSVSGGEMPGSLLGMSYLDRFGRISIEDGRLILER